MATHEFEGRPHGGSAVHRLMFVCLLPVIAGQALWVRRVAPRLPEPSGAREGLTGRGTPLRLLVVGDSSAAGVGATTQGQALAGQLVSLLADVFMVEWKVVARSGWRTTDLIRTLDNMTAEIFDVAVTAVGVNDVTSGNSVRKCLLQRIQLVDLLRGRFGVKHTILSGMPPMHKFPSLPEPLRGYLGNRALRLDAAVRDWSLGRNDLSHLPMTFAAGPEIMAGDGFHPGPGLYALWAQAAAVMIKDKLRDRVADSTSSGLKPG